MYLFPLLSNLFMTSPAIKLQTSDISSDRTEQISTTRPYQVCTRCVMDTSDAEIVFDENGECNHCRFYRNHVKGRVLKGIEAEKGLEKLIEKIKAAGKGNSYDCLIGVSGGTDSTYTVYMAKKLGLRPIALHFDNGWNSELAVSNIEKVLKHLGVELITDVVNWEEFRDLQLSFLKASTPDSEIPTDHGMIAAMMKAAAKLNIKYVVCGTNFSTEGVYVRSWGYGHNDWFYIKQLHKKFGTIPFKTFPHYGVLGLLYYFGIRKIRFVSLLNYLDYDKDKAIETLEKEVGWRAYSGKHHESVYTKFFQSYILPRKFNIDKRRAHLSGLIFATDGRFTREQALEKLKEPIAPENEILEDKKFVAKKLGLTEAEFDSIMALPIKSYRDYPSRHDLIMGLKRLQDWLRKIGLFPK